MALPVTLDDAKRQLRVLGNVHDAEIEQFILDAAGWVEEYTGHLLEQREITERFSGFERVRLSAWPVNAGTVVVKASGLPVVGARLHYVSRPATLYPALNTAWPRLYSGDMVEVTYSAGYADPADVPRNFRRAMLLLIAAYFDDRSGGEQTETAVARAKDLCRSKKRHST